MTSLLVARSPELNLLFKADVAANVGSSNREILLMIFSAYDTLSFISEGSSSPKTELMSWGSDMGGRESF